MRLDVLSSRFVNVIAIFGVCLALAAGCGGPAGSERVLAGAAAVDITPVEWPLPMIGSFRYRPASSAHDPLRARALAIRSGSETVAIAVVDSCYLPRETVDRAKELAREATGLATDRMLVSATHTHSAPPPAPGAGLRGLESERHDQNEERYFELLVEGIAASIIQALQGLQPAEVGWATAPFPDEVFNRRWHMREGSIPPDPFGRTTDRVRMNPPFASPDLIEPSGPVDPQVAVRSVRSASGDPLALLANYSLHYVGGIPAGQVSADYFGEFANLVEQRIGAGDGFVGILSNGTSGNINNLDFSKPRVPKQPFEQVRHVASGLADVVAAAYAGIDHSPAAGVAMAQSELSLARRKPSDALIAQSRALLDDPPGTATARQIIYAQRAIDLHEGPSEVSVVLQALRVGELGIAALPFETFVETGLEIKSRSPMRPTFVISLANGAEGYLPTPAHHQLGGYETWLGTSRVEAGASGKIEDELLALLNAAGPAGN